MPSCTKRDTWDAITDSEKWSILVPDSEKQPNYCLETTSGILRALGERKEERAAHWHNRDAAFAWQIWGQWSETIPQPAGRDLGSRNALCGDRDCIKARHKERRGEASWGDGCDSICTNTLKALRVDALCFSPHQQYNAPPCCVGSIIKQEKV